MESFILVAILLAAAVYLGRVIWSTIYKDKGCQCSSGDCCSKEKTKECNKK